MDIILTEKSIRKFLQTPASIEDIIQHLCNSGPTVDRYHKVGDDTILEIEIITNRIDSASVFGVAREANAILSQNGIDTKLVNNPYNHKATDYSHQTETLKFTTTDNLLFKRFTAIIIRNVSIKTSPPEIVDLLEKTGQRPINNIVDATNEATLLYGLPTHVFDADKLALQKLLIREARAGETLTTLDETKINLNDGDLIIEDGQNRLVDLCGVMGGQVAVVDEHTTSIVLIAPVYQPKKIRQTSLAHQKRTLAAQIYEKGPDPFLTMPVLDLLIQSIIKRAGGQVTSKIFDQNNYQPKTKNLEIDLNWLSKIAGVAISESQAISILSNLGFLNTHTTSNNVLTTTVPSFRQEDINLREDLAEEIIRIYGYYNLPATLPTLTKMPTATNPIFSLERKLKTILVNTGFNEIYNSSLISKSLIESTEQNLSGHLKLTNSLSEDLEYLRTTLVPSALQNHLNNKGKGSDPLKIFELANVYLPTTDNSPPKEVSTLIFSSTLPVLTLKSILEKIFVSLNYPNYSFKQPAKVISGGFDQQNTADILVEGELLGQIGEIKSSIMRRLDLLGTISLVELNISQLNLISPTLKYQPISEYPTLKEDITLKSDQPIGEIIDQIKNSNPNITQIRFKESFQNHHTFEITIGSNTQNLTKQDAELIRTNILNNFKE